MTPIQMEASFQTVTILLWSLVLACKITGVIPQTTSPEMAVPTSTTTATTAKAEANPNKAVFTNHMIVGLAAGFGGICGLILLCCIVWCCCCGRDDDKKKVVPGLEPIRVAQISAKPKNSAPGGRYDDRRHLQSASTASTTSGGRGPSYRGGADRNARGQRS